MKSQTHPSGLVAPALCHQARETPKGAAIRKLEAIFPGDVEAAHAEADQVLCELLKALGMGDVVAKWEAIPKWYA